MTAISPGLELDGAAAPEAALAQPGFDEVYEQLFDFVWRSLRRLGVPRAGIDDAVQDVFVVVHRRLPEFEGRSSLRTWVFGIALRVAHDHRRRARRKGGLAPLDPRMADEGLDPDASLARSEAVRELDRILGGLDEGKRAVFVLVEIEEMSAPEAALALGANVNTVYSRLRAARREVLAALSAPRGGFR
jgi:RNA polymerase sigma-70 factor (ECF subfamily)